MIAEDLSPGRLGVSPQIYSPSDFREIQRMVYAMAGITVPDHKATLVYSRLVPRLRDTASATFGEYLQRLKSDREERYTALCALTTNHTHFFRESHHMEHMRTHLLDEWLDRLANRGQVRVWSAGCSSGEEPWSILLSLLGERSDGLDRLKRGSFRLLATDIDRNVLKVAQEAKYPLASREGIPRELAERWTEIRDNEFILLPQIRSFLSIRMLNLVGEWPMQCSFDAIYCRNVMIYFDVPTKARLLERLANQLKPGGILYIGHSERITSGTLPQLREIGPTIYRKEGGAE